MPKKVKKVKTGNGDEEDGGPTNEELRAMIRRLVPKVNLQNTGVKAFIALLSKECGGMDLKSRTTFIKEALAEAINDMEESDDDSEEESGEESEDEEPTSSKKRKKASSSSGERGLAVKKQLSPELAKFLGQGNSMARTEVVKLLWVYIKEHGLQNPDNKREIFLDAKMKKVFGVDTFTMFTMNKYVGAHIHPFKPVDLTSATTTRKRKTGKADKRDSKKSPGKKKRKPKKPGLQPPYRLSAELSDVVGTDILPRPQVVSAIWDYIKSNGLQNPKDKREIICDDKLKSIMGGNSKVTMFNMNRYITQHLVEKLDRSAYNHDAAVASIDEPEGDDDDDDDEEEEEEEDSDE